MKAVILLFVGSLLFWAGACSKKRATSQSSGVASVEISPNTRSFIIPSQIITLAFPEAMNTATYTLGGEMSAEVGAPEWSTSTQLVVSPSTSWSEGADRTFSFSGTTSTGASVTFSATYDVVGCDLYVATTGSDANPGTSAFPKLTIQAGIGAASSGNQVCVSKGTYSVNSAVTLASNVSVYGGWSTDWSTNDPATNVTAVTDTRTSGGTANSPLSVFFASGNFGTAVLGGFVANAASGTYSAGFTTNNGYNLAVKRNTFNGGSGSTRSRGALLFIDATNTLVLKWNTLNGGTGPSSIGVHVVSSAGTVQDNTVNAGSGTSNYGIYLDAAMGGSVSGNAVTGGGGSNSYGVYINISNDTISGNTITGGSGSTASYGMYLINSTAPFPVISGNSVEGGSGASSYGIYVIGPNSNIGANQFYGGTGTTASYGVYVNSCNPTLFNNLIYGGTAANTYGVYLMNPGSPILRNNTIDGGTASGQSAGLFISGADKPKMQNNLFFTSGGTTRYCIYINLLIVGSELTFGNNDLFDCPTTGMYDLYSTCTLNHDGDADSHTCDVTDLNATYTSSFNFSATPVFTDYSGADGLVGTLLDNDWSLAAVSPASVLTGGLDGASLSWAFTTDYAGTTRTGSAGAGWSVGAYEKD